MTQIKVKQPEYQRPFEQDDFRGYFKWTPRLTSDLGGNLYHACHKKELKTILVKGELGLRSKWSLKLPKHGLWPAPGTWMGLNYFHKGNYYGPFLIVFPLAVLNGRHFMVFRRRDNRRNRHFFVQYEARIPIYSYGKKLWRKVEPRSYFQTIDDNVAMKPGAIYDIVLTKTVGLNNIEIQAVDHPHCISGKCNGLKRLQGRRILRKIAEDEFFYWLEQNRGYERLIRRFPDLVGEEVELIDPSEF